MKALLKLCTVCQEYTLHETCTHCGGQAAPNRPAKFSPEDHHGEYRRQLKLLVREQEVE
jgi:H/ACA ribonucleoprotein complex subunit 3